MQTVQTLPKRTDSIVETVPGDELHAFHPSSLFFYCGSGVDSCRDYLFVLLLYSWFELRQCEKMLFRSVGLAMLALGSGFVSAHGSHSNQSPSADWATRHMQGWSLSGVVKCAAC